MNSEPKILKSRATSNLRSNRKSPSKVKTTKVPSSNLSKESVISTESSLGILPLDNFNFSSENWKPDVFTKQVLQTYDGLPSYYFQKNVGTPSAMDGLASESTVNESDLSKQFAPAEVSTPRSSHLSDIAKNVALFKNQISNSDLSLSELCQKFSKIGAELDIQDESFVSSDLAIAKIKQHEQSWLKERGIVGNKSVCRDSIFSMLDNGNLTDFFRKKSELADVCLRNSPEKEDVPVPLVDAVENSESILSLTAFENADTTAQVLNLLRQCGNKENQQDEGNFNKQPTCINRSLSEVNILNDSSNICNKSVSSVYTASSLDSLSSGKLPIETNRTELTWGCVQVGKKVLQSFILRNKSHNKIHLQMTSSNTCFTILTDQDFVSTLPILLYPAESRCFKIAFLPSALGGYVDKLNFTPISDKLKSQQTKRQVLMLYGYGGHAHVNILNVAKDSNMKMWLCFEKLDSKGELHQEFIVKNMGTLVAFACFNFSSKVLYGFSKVTIHPVEIVLDPKAQMTVTVTYTPTKDDLLKHMLTTSMNQVMEIGSLQVISGAEALRARIRNLCGKLTEDSIQLPNNLCAQLNKTFPNEKMLPDTQKFTETVGSIKELLQNLVVREITLTIERDSDTTILGQIAGLDESSFFQSFSEGITIIANSETSSICTVEPLHLVLTPPIKVEDCIVLSSHHDCPLKFKISVEPIDLLRIRPTEGTLLPNATSIVKIGCNLKQFKHHNENRSLRVLINVEKDLFEINVKIIFLKAAKAK